MKVLLTKDVYKLGRAGEIKKVADGYGRNFLLPQGLAVLATAGALRQVEKIKAQAEIRRGEQNNELKGLADQIAGTVLSFAAKAGETGKLYGSITTQDVAAALQEKTRFEVKRQQIDMQPIRELGEFAAHVRLTMDLVPEIKVVVHREGEALEAAEEEGKHKRKGKKAEEAAPAEPAPAPEAVESTEA
jgi:large subunit ribosomal protein L9